MAVGLTLEQIVNAGAANFRIAVKSATILYLPGNNGPNLTTKEQLFSPEHLMNQEWAGKKTSYKV